MPRRPRARPRRGRRIASCCIVAVTTATAAHAQQRPAPGSAPPTAAAPAQRDGWEITPFVAYGGRSPTRIWGHTPDRGHRVLGVQFARRIAGDGAVALDYAPSVAPLFVVTNNPRYGRVSFCDRVCRPGEVDEDPVLGEVGRGATYGVAVTPLGLRLRAHVAPGTALFLTTAVGAVRFTRAVPEYEARRTNVTLEAGAGVSLGTGVRRVLLGYKYHHLSNAYTARRNPGLDGHLLYAGLGIALRGR